MSKPARPTAAELFPGAMEEYLQASAELAREEARIRQEYERETVRLRRETGRRLAMVLGIDAEKWADACAAMMLAPDLRWRLQACRVVLGALRARAARGGQERVA